jgi:saccharopine dehydrogenase-like NADP-dependent oxidoreductase
MKTVAILGGAGLMGHGVLRDLISDRAVCRIARIVVCDVSAERIGALLRELNDPRLEAKVLDVGDTDALRAALSGMDLCINAIPTLAGHQMAIFEACLSARVNYIDLGGLGIYTVPQKQAHARFRAAGVTAVIGTGSDPGMSNVICRLVADQLDSIEKINLYWAAEYLGPESPVLTLPYALSTVLAEYGRPSQQFLDGRHVEVPPMSGVEVVELPPPWGATSFMYSMHSEQLTVPLADGIREKGIREFTWKLHLPRRENEAWVGLIKAGFADFDEPVELGGMRVRPLDVLEAVMARNLARHKDRIPVQESHEIHLARGKGVKDGLPTEIRCEVTIGPHALYEPYTDAATSMNVSIAAQLLLLADHRPGVWAPEEFFDVGRYVAELRKRHFTLRTVVTQTVMG